MKKLFTLLAGVALSVGAFAQQIPNGGFETWTTPAKPDSWGTISSALGGQGYTYFAVKDTAAANHVEGAASIRLTTDTVTAGPSLSTFPGMVGLGSAVYAQGISFPGIPYTKRIDTIYLAFKYTPANVNDTAALIFNLKKNGVSLFGGSLQLPISTTGGTMQGVYLPLIASGVGPDTYYSNTTTTPDSLQFFAFSSADSAYQGSKLWLDAIHFDVAATIVGPNGIADLDGNVLGVNVYPNPANNSVNVAVETSEIGAAIQLFDVAGREVYNSTITTDKFAIDTRNYESGVYSIRVKSTDNMTTYKGKFTITH